MKNKLPIIYLLLVLSATVTSAISEYDAAAIERGQAIADQLRRRTRGFESLTAVLRLSLESRRGSTSERELRFMLLEKDDDLLGLCLVDAPTDVRGTALLTHNLANGHRDQWVYLPATQRTRRIASQNRSGSFLGSEFTYEDLAGGFSPEEQASTVWLRDEVYRHRPCHVVIYFPLDPKVTEYARRVAWIDQEDHRIHRIDYYNRREELLKTLTLTDHRLYQDQFWYAHQMEMVNVITGNRSRLEWQNITLGNALQASDFAPHRLPHLP